MHLALQRWRTSPGYELSQSPWKRHSQTRKRSDSRGLTERDEAMEETEGADDFAMKGKWVKKPKWHPVLLMASKKTLSAVDYVLFFGSLLLTLLVGMYQAWKGRRDSAEEMLVASKGLSLPPVVLSLAATYLSAIVLLGTPAEIYANGSEWWMQIVGYTVGTVLATLVFVPVLHPPKFASLYTYLEMRFESKLMRWTGTLLYILGTTLYMGLGLYAPVIAVSSVTDFPEWIGIAVCGGLCTVYTAIGGLKAVVWTDAIQIFLMLAGILAVIIYGVVDVGGFQQVWNIAQEYNRTEFFNTSLSPFERHSFWWIFLSITCTWFTVNGPTQSAMQRYNSVPTMRKAQLSVLLVIPIGVGIISLSCFSGLVAFASYKGCDPLKAGLIKKKDEIIPYFVMDKLGHLVGLPGVFLACLFAGALSTISSGMNSVAAVILESVQQTSFGKHLSPKQTATYTKLIATGSGLVTIALAFAVGILGAGLMQMVVTITAVTSGPTLALFLTAVLFPFVNKHGAFVGVIASLATTSWLGFGAYIVGVPGPIPLDSSVDACNFNVTPSPTSLPPDIDE
ncbi:unnamed protein product [Darwinula stevensoni]|uniref:Uncharacterized protein n=1 Tax=Darwinula stevensoni TaxID=69355 RepID=A0A7R8X9I5_9CRUS|nr:unnamed protein product [Darwinula stevensoni]CAG0882591.1 unnamed protein product [Darwinula stevensoni]